jgi:hypothetical protein
MLGFEGLTIFIAQFLSVFTLVLGSKLLRDDRWVLAMLNSWMISVTQFLFVYLVSSSADPMELFFWSGAGGSLGCGISHLAYTRWIFKNKQ